jgi:hypothetical protein
MIGGRAVVVIVTCAPVVDERPTPGLHVHLLQLQLLSSAFKMSTGSDVIPG